jgi:hypothetical protein
MFLRLLSLKFRAMCTSWLGSMTGLCGVLRSGVEGVFARACPLVLPMRSSPLSWICGSDQSICDAPPFTPCPSTGIVRDKGEAAEDPSLLRPSGCPSLVGTSKFRELRFALASSWCPTGPFRGPLPKLESSRNPPDRRTRCLRRAKSSSCTESAARRPPLVRDCPPSTPSIAPGSCLATKLLRWELPCPLCP